ncbi:hypothetical protein ACROYT_G042956 [Oculina patagonica]
MSIHAYSFVLICLCITQQACWARSKHLKEWVTRSAKAGKENLIDGAVPLDQFDSNECSVKTVDGQSPGQCCMFPFLYKGSEQTSCVKAVTGDFWCAVTYNYDQEKQWGWCPEQESCSVKTVDGQSPDQCCKFPFLYKGTEQTSCVIAVTGDKSWCAVTYNYDQEKQWGWCQLEEQESCSVKTVDGQSPDQCCKFPFLYKGTEQTSCVIAVTGDKSWCAVTYNYDQEKQWGWCQPEGHWKGEIHSYLRRPINFGRLSRLNQDRDKMKQKMIHAYSFVLICLCITQQACWARSKHLKEWVTRSAKAGKENLIDGVVPLDQFDSNECSVKTVDGQSPDQCCKFPFLYKGTEQTSCVKAVTGDKSWCAVTYNYDQEKQWGWCPAEQESCSVKTVDGQSPDQCCKFPFLYKGTEQTSCVKAVTGDKSWCSVTYNYDQEKQWGWCQREGKMYLKS